MTQGYQIRVKRSVQQELTNREEQTMAYKTWQTLNVRFCEHAGCDIAYEVLVVYPSEIMPDQEPRILARRCSEGFNCNLTDHPGCVWSGTNPLYDPFSESA
jgi:hypothetical protein